MKPSGILLVLGGVWVLCQVLGGNALGRLNITGGGSSSSTGSTGSGSGSGGSSGGVIGHGSV